MKRECGSCTKCCEGWLPGTINNYQMFKGKPCHFVSINEGCTIYSKRPQDPCVAFKCEWLHNLNFPEWLKPNVVNAIFKMSTIGELSYLSLIEAGAVLDSRVLTWAIQYALTNQINFYWEVQDGCHWFGSTDFVNLMAEQSKGKSQNQEPKYLPLVLEE